MTTPNENLISKLRGQAYTSYRPDQLCDQAADLLQSQAERISGLEKEVAFQIKMKEQHCKRLADERDTLRAELAAIAAAEPVAYMVQFSPGSRWVELTKEEFDSDLDGHIVYKKQAFFTRPMPAQDVTGLVDCLSELCDIVEGVVEDKSSVGSLIDSFTTQPARTALSKYRGAK